jgi:hypothetical protein
MTIISLPDSYIEPVSTLAVYTNERIATYQYTKGCDWQSCITSQYPKGAPMRP